MRTFRLEYMNIYVGNLSYDVEENELRELFGNYGPVSKATVIIDRDTGRSKGFGFVEMETSEAGQAAIDALDGNDFQGRKLKVNEARPREERPPRSGGGGGGFGGGGGGFGGGGGGFKKGGKGKRGGGDFGGGGGGKGRRDRW